jgi:predicted TIM-barrel fold metal-dependent hydrolase
MNKIDAHIHYSGDHPDCIALLQRLELKMFNVCVAHGVGDGWRDRAVTYRKLASEYPSRYAWCTTFDPPDYVEPDYVERAIAGLERDFRDGAVACKMWKNIGMEIVKPSGEFLMMDDPLFDPIYEYLARSGVPVLAHIGEPLACWQPLSEDNAHRGYYSAHPEWHMYNKPEFPSHKEIIDARDRVLAKHPALRVVGAHLGSLEYDVAEIAKRLDRYPNFAVDSSARLHDLAWQDRDAVRQFFVAYQDRILFGTDLVQRELQSAVPDPVRQQNLERVELRYKAEAAYYETDHMLHIRGREARGLALPSEVLAKFYHANALEWYPGV